MITGGAIATSVFVMRSAGNNDTVIQATANAPIIGVSQVGSHDPPGTTGASANAATGANQFIQFFINGDVCSLTVGAAGVSAGDYVRSDANGAAVTGSLNQDNIGAWALETAPGGSIVKAVVFIQNNQSATSPFLAVTTNTTLTIANSNGIVQANVSGASITITLPPVSTLAAGDTFTVGNLLAAGSGAGTLVAINSADTGTVTMYGHAIASPAAGKGLVNTQATAAVGDTAQFMFDGTNWLSIVLAGTWTRQS
jgi:hypothetical protein